MTAPRPDSWRLVKSERGSLRESVVDFRDGWDGGSEHTERRTVPRIALFYSNPEVLRSFDSLVAMGALELTTFSLDSFAGSGDSGNKARRGWKKDKRFEAVVIEATAKAGDKKLMAWLRRMNPGDADPGRRRSRAWARTGRDLSLSDRNADSGSSAHRSIRCRTTPPAGEEVFARFATASRHVQAAGNSF